ncbi:MAG: SGNH/GDSL hydrolase family protein [Lentisphaeria bacterium]|nr:SGNH/GDSL hydrolase family protein [Lentisphaeria bacterium]NQZ70964.1 SGNH/GDSL hydrolase family protein [Lentisphaeria bacterium]
MKIKDGQTIVFIGDSITDCGRGRGENTLGNGYVKTFSDLFTIREPKRTITIINRGISGDNVKGLQGRWADDVLRNKPDFLSVKIGINDISNFLQQGEITPAVFQDAYDDILSRTMAALPKCKILLIDPFFLSVEKSPSSGRTSYMGALPAYHKAIAKMSKKYNTAHLKTHAMFQNLLKYHDPNKFCPEPVHPNPTGHLAIAEAVYQKLS